MRIFSTSAVCICLLGFAAPEIARGIADRSAENAVAALIAALPGAEAASIRSLGGAARIEVAGVGVSGPGWRLTIERLVLPGADSPVPSLVSTAFARPASVSAENVSLTLGDTKVVIPHMEARGTDLTSPMLTALLDPADPANLADRLARLTAAEIAAPQVLLGSPRADDLAARDHLTLKNVSLTDVNAGRIGAVAIESVLFTSPDGTTTSTQLETGHVDVAGVDLPLALDMATGSRTEAATALKPLFRSFSVSGIAIHPDAETTLQAGAILAGALRGRPLTLPPSDAMALLDKPESDRSPADRQILSDLAADAAGSLALDHLELRNASVSKTGGQPGSFKLARAVVDDFEVVRLGAVTVEGVTFGEAGTDVSLGRFVLGGYDGSAVVGLIRQRLGEAADATAIQVVPGRTSMTMTDLHVAIPAAPGGGMGALDPNKRILIDVPVASVGAGSDAATGAITSRAKVEMAYDVSAGAADPSFRDLVSYGLSRLDVGADYAGSFDPGAKEIRLERFSVDAQNFGQVAVTGVLGNASPDMFHAGQSQNDAMQAAQNLVFQSFTFAFVNTGVVEKVLPPLAASAKVSVPLFKAQMKAQAEISINQMMGPGPAAARIIAALRTFIDTPKNLFLAIKAPSGVPLGTAASTSDPKALLGMLDIQVTANR